MRVIGGTYRSRRLIAPRGLATRPTSDRLRETLFNVLAARIEGAVFADLYAGSGAVGIEALSRGASLVYFVDSAAPAITAIRSNLAALEIHSGFQIVSSGVSAALRRLSETSSRCAIIFLDPPYAASGDYDSTLAAIGAGGRWAAHSRRHRGRRAQPQNAPAAGGMLWPTASLPGAGAGRRGLELL